MRVGLLSDIHADLQSFTKALRLLHRHDVDLLVCAGDLVGRGSQPDEVVALIGQHGISCVLGNHDEQAITNPGSMPILAGRIPGYPAESVGPLALDHLRSLPLSSTFQWQGVRVLLAHGTPWCNRTYLFAEHLPDGLERDLAQLEVDVVIVGHTHVPMKLMIGRVLLVNPGSVCNLSPRDSHTCAILHLPSLRLDLFELGTDDDSHTA